PLAVRKYSFGRKSSNLHPSEQGLRLVADRGWCRERYYESAGGKPALLEIYVFAFSGCGFEDLRFGGRGSVFATGVISF
ncbi:MAG: hypothetical protein KBS45_02995, partial [Clostridiales bacterium]|nr:hypothetical protein [Candidatus Coliplasma caballi]